jgi:hypothetical protein
MLHASQTKEILSVTNEGHESREKRNGERLKIVEVGDKLPARICHIFVLLNLLT